MNTKKTFVIAEIGNNHEGNLALAKKMILLANKSGVDAVKFQTYNTNDFINPILKKNFKRLKKFELSINQFKILRNFAKKLKLKFITTPLDLNSLKKISNNLDIIKIASSDNNFFYLIEEALKTKKKIIISLGLTDNKLLKIIKKKILFFLNKYNISKKKVAFLHCVTSYPVEDAGVNLKAILFLKNFFKPFDVGYSDHSIGNEACVGAVSLGAKIIEKHFTFNKKFSSFRDHKLSADYHDMHALVKSIRKIEIQLGKKEKIINKTEKSFLKVLRRAAYAKRLIKKNKKLDKNDFLFQRPWAKNSTLNPKKLLGKKVIKNINKYKLIKLKDLK